MSSLLSLLNVARDGIIAQSGALQVTGENVSNANTPGYVRRSAILQTRALGSSNGTVEFAGIRRNFDRFVYGRVLDESGKYGAAGARARELGGIEQLVAPEQGGVREALTGFFSALSALSTNPKDRTSRSLVLQKSEVLAQNISQTAAGLAQSRTDLLGKAQGVAGEVNERLGKIAELNQKIAAAQAMGEPAADLRDTREVMVRDVSDRMGARAIEDEAGNISLFAGGAALVTGNTASTVQVDVDPAGAMRLQVPRPGGAAIDITSQVNSGSLGGLREVRDVDVVAAQSGLDKLAFDLANSVNAVHSTGVGLDGVSGRNLFQAPVAVAGAAYAFKVDASVAGAPDNLGASANAADLPGGGQVALLLAQLAQSPLAGGGTPSERVGSWLGDVGIRKSAADSEMSIREGTVAQAQALHDSSTGVSVDEEMIDLTRYQRAFEASTRVLRAADELLSNLIKEL